MEGVLDRPVTAHDGEQVARELLVHYDRPLGTQTTQTPARDPAIVILMAGLLG
ncbi:hypothetical protein ACVMB1_000217 [Bradyrhizobium sp. USDA 4504]